MVSINSNTRTSQFGGVGKTVHYYVDHPAQTWWLSNTWVIGLAIGIGLSVLAGGASLLKYKSAKAPPGTLKHLIFEGESGTRGYNSYNRGSMRCAKSNRRDLNLTNMTIQQIQYYQSLPSCSHEKLLAVGHYQIVPETLNKAVRTLNLPPHTKFTPEVQDSIFALYLAKEKQPAIRRWICTGEGLHRAAHAVAGEWAIFKTPYTGRGVYDGHGNNHARISAKRVLSALEKARSDYMKLTDAGLDPDSAYAAALGVKAKESPPSPVQQTPAPPIQQFAPAPPATIRVNLPQPAPVQPLPIPTQTPQDNAVSDALALNQTPAVRRAVAQQ